MICRYIRDERIPDYSDGLDKMTAMVTSSSEDQCRCPRLFSGEGVISSLVHPEAGGSTEVELVNGTSDTLDGIEQWYGGPTSFQTRTSMAKLECHQVSPFSISLLHLFLQKPSLQPWDLQPVVLWLPHRTQPLC